MIALSKIVNFIDFFYDNVFKSAVIYLFKIYHGNGNKRLRLNCIDDAILAISATELAKQIRSRKITCEAVIRTYIKRIKEIQPILNCIVDERFDEAIQDARNIDRLIANNEIDLNLLLLGIPFTCSESICVKGMKNSSGLVCRKQLKADNDAEVIKLMKNAGAILLCTTNTSELGLWVETKNHVYGRTCNPYDFRRIAGGSAGGEGSLISACGSLIGLGIDFSGGLRLAGSFNGIFAHKPTHGLIDTTGCFPNNLTNNLNKMLTIGPLCRYSEDLNILLDILYSNDENNNNKIINYDDKLDLKDLNFYYIDSIDASFSSKSSNDVMIALNNLVNFFELHSGNQVKKLNSKYLSKGFNIWISLFENYNDSYQLNKLITNNKNTENLFLEFLYNFIGIGNHTLPILSFSCIEALFAIIKKNETNKYYNLIEQLREELDALLGNNGVILIPTFPTVAPFHNQAIWTNPIDSIIYNGLFNVLGFPITQVCAGLNSERMPIGIQLVSNRYCDRLTIKLSNLIEYIRGGWLEAC